MSATATTIPVRTRLSQSAATYRFELIALSGIALLIIAFLAQGRVSPAELASVWFMPFLGIVGATVAMSTPAGGGIVFFPTLVLLGVAPVNAVAFSVATQTFGMGIFGTYNWSRKAPEAILKPAVVLVALGGWVGVLLALFVFPLTSARAVRLLFSTFGLCLALYIVLSARNDLHINQTPFRLRGLMAPILFVSGVAGGMLTGYIGVGIDVLIFVVLTWLYHTHIQHATVTSIVIMGLTSALPFMFALFFFGTLPLNLWLMVLPGVLLGARIGPWLNTRLGSERVMLLFSLLLILEFCMTFTKLVLLY